MSLIFLPTLRLCFIIFRSVFCNDILYVTEFRTGIKTELNFILLYETKEIFMSCIFTYRTFCWIFQINRMTKFCTYLFLINSNKKWSDPLTAVTSPIPNLTIIHPLVFFQVHIFSLNVLTLGLLNIRSSKINCYYHFANRFLIVLCTSSCISAIGLGYMAVVIILILLQPITSRSGNIDVKGAPRAGSLIAGNIDKIMEIVDHSREAYTMSNTSTANTSTASNRTCTNERTNKDSESNCRRF